MSISKVTFDKEFPQGLHQKILEAFVNDEGFALREKILRELHGIAVIWVEKTAEQKGWKKSLEKGYGTRLVPFGGHCNKVVMKDGDIDVICITPNCVTFEEFFGSFVEELHQSSKVTKLKVVRGAKVPIIKLVYCNIEVDMCLAIVNKATIHSDIDLLQDEVFIGMDLTSCRSLNGLRETKELQKLIPDYKNYCSLLKIAKFWAKAQGIHCSAMGYLGGMALSVLVAKVCQLYPNASLCDLLRAFFDTFSNWDWPEPVLLLPLQGKDPFNLKPWNPKINRADTFHLMPIIKPCYPELNCASAVTSSTRTIITRAFTAGKSKEILEILQSCIPFPHNLP